MASIFIQVSDMVKTIITGINQQPAVKNTASTSNGALLASVQQTGLSGGMATFSYKNAGGATLGTSSGAAQSHSHMISCNASGAPVYQFKISSVTTGTQTASFNFAHSHRIDTVESSGSNIIIQLGQFVAGVGIQAKDFDMATSDWFRNMDPYFVSGSGTNIKVDLGSGTLSYTRGSCGYLQVGTCVASSVKTSNTGTVKAVGNNGIYAASISINDVLQESWQAGYDAGKEYGWSLARGKVGLKSSGGHSDAAISVPGSDYNTTSTYYAKQSKQTLRGAGDSSYAYLGTSSGGGTTTVASVPDN